MSLQLQFAAASYIFIHYALKKKAQNVTEMVDEKCFCQQRKSWGSSLLRDLKLQSVSGQYKNVTRMSPIEFE
jgi:hypothetical protein